jgi:hypothetical protein
MSIRLIQINWALGETHSVHLISSLEIAASPVFEETPPYLALSHCWGDADIVKLRTDNLTQFRENISLQWFLWTFLDTIRSTVLLGYKCRMWEDRARGPSKR